MSFAQLPSPQEEGEGHTPNTQDGGRGTHIALSLLMSCLYLCTIPCSKRVIGVGAMPVRPQLTADRVRVVCGCCARSILVRMGGRGRSSVDERERRG